MNAITEEQFFQVFNPMAGGRSKALRDGGIDLCHYTSASNALRILRDTRITLRNSTLMNDFLEVEHGQNCLAEAWRSPLGVGSDSTHPGRLARILNSVSPTIVPAIAQQYDALASGRRLGSFLISLAEHDEATEGQLGRLSMWRAYGGRTNVSLVIDPKEALTGEQRGLFSCPVHYCSAASFVEDFFSEFVAALENNIDFLKELGRDTIVFHINWVLNCLALSLKHPGFHEEREWRVIYAPWLYDHESISRSTIDIQGVPQMVAHFDLEPSPEAVGPRALHKILKKIINGPTEHPWVLYDAFCHELDALGFKEAGQRVVVSNIPIRR